MDVRSWLRHLVLYAPMILSLILISRCDVAAAVGLATDSRPWMNQSLGAEERANLLLKEMTLDEKIALMHGVDRIKDNVTSGNGVEFVLASYVGYVPANKRLGIPALRMADGRAGVGNRAKNVTLLPAPIVASSAWDTGLMKEFGRVLGQEQWAKGTNVALGPSIDVIRVPEWGRSFESYGEDPWFNGRMAVAEIEGIQSQGPIADANMYLTMNQESDRFKEDSIVDERTMEEIYLPPFEAAVRDGHVGTFMCAYVKTNGVYSCENSDILQHILREQLKFDGWVMSDWGATHSTIDSANHGLDQEMPDDKFFGAALKRAVEDGHVGVATIDERVRHILVPMFRQGLFDKDQPGNWKANVRDPKHDLFSLAVSEQGTVLLKNDGAILPLTADTSVAVIGEAGHASPKVEGGGSSGVVPPYIVSPFDGIRKRAQAGANIAYADGSDLAAAAKTASAAQVAIVVVHTDETEGRDRPDLQLPGEQDRLIFAVAQANKNTIVVLDTGGPVLMPWAGSVAGIIEAWYPGQEDGNALAAILYGDIDPSAKLPLTFPKTADAIPTASRERWPGVDGRSIYTERLNVGYRWYDATNTEPLFPFGFGLSYTTFSVSNLAVDRSAIAAKSLESGAKVRIDLDVTNTGKRAGAEVVQVYVCHPASNGEPPHRLAAFGKIDLKPGETKPVVLTIDSAAFRIFNVKRQEWEIPQGTYEILAGTSSRDLPLNKSVTIQ